VFVLCCSRFVIIWTPAFAKLWVGIWRAFMNIVCNLILCRHLCFVNEAGRKLFWSTFFKKII
jgi:hypothetical protein